MKKYFIVEEMNDVFLVRCCSIEGLPFKFIQKGSLNVLKARLFGTTYPNYLRLARDQYNAQLRGRAGGYINEFFIHKADTEILCQELNRRLNLVLSKKG